MIRLDSEYVVIFPESSETETITIKQENGLLLQYELPVEHDPTKWTRTVVHTPSSAVVTKSPGQRKRGRPRKYPNKQGQIGIYDDHSICRLPLFIAHYCA